MELMEHSKAIAHLESLIQSILSAYKDTNTEWRMHAQIQNFPMFNQKKYRVSDLGDNPSFFESIYGYTTFLNQNHKPESLFNIEGDGYLLTCRVKNQNSIQDKYNEYSMERRQKIGDVNVNKCFNDLFGIRVIYNINELKKENIQYLEERYPIKINERSVPPNDSGYGYTAIHIYFKEDNTTFQWELQIWLAKHRESNLKSHSHHRYKYSKWEKEE
ncbi:MAG: hypothetical protein MJZ38_06965 [archaeon]|nr:hypothetical protein [archaeon]